MHFDKRILHAADQLALIARRPISASATGKYRSLFRGSGMQFKEFRHYEPGDDIRHMSWPVTARTGRATLKTYEEERQIDVVLLVDTSGSSWLANGVSRWQVYQELTAVLGLAALRYGDSLGMLLFDRQTRLFLRPQKSRSHLHRALRILSEQKPGPGPSDLRPSLHYLETLLHHRSLILILSDFLLEDFTSEISALARRHEILLLHTRDPREKGQGLEGVYEIWDPETEQFSLVDGQSEATQMALFQSQQMLEGRFSTLKRQSGIDFFTLSITDDYLHELVRFFRQREHSAIR